MDPLDRLKELLGLKGRAKKTAGKAKKAKAEPENRGPAPLNLDSSEFLPITTDELRDSLERLVREGGFRFEGRGFIPFGDDRTKLINRALISHGLLTPEEVAEITKI